MLRRTAAIIAGITAFGLFVPSLASQQFVSPPSDTRSQRVTSAGDQALRQLFTSVLPVRLIEPVRPARAPAAGRDPSHPAAGGRTVTTTHTVRNGETLWDIARRYNLRVEDLVELNDLGDSEWIRPGQRLLVSSTALPRHRRSSAQAGDRRRSQLTRVQTAALRAPVGFTWPARGMLTSRYGWRWRRHHNGIDLANPRGTPIVTAGTGVVAFAGWHTGYGRMVHVDHGGGVMTVYGHASQLLVSVGQRVTKGQMIARVGCTGWCTGSHLHFEVRVDGRAVDPLRYLR